MKPSAPVYGSDSRRKAGPRHNPRRLAFEGLEPRRVLSALAGPNLDWNGSPHPIANLLLVSTAVDENDGDHSRGDVSLREALALATETPSDDVIYFDGTLAGSTITLDPLLGQLEIDSNVDVRSPGDQQLTIDADGNGRVLRVAEGVQVSLNGVRITGGQTDGPGGGIYSAGSLTLADTTITGNSAGHGGGIFVAGGALTITDATISRNSARGAGGGICYLRSATRPVANITITDATVSGNSANSGGGIHAERYRLTIANSAISGNSAQQDGGGIKAHCALTITDTAVSGNSATRGGGIWSSSTQGSLLWRTSICENSADHGGGIYVWSGVHRLQNVTVSANSATRAGSGVRVISADVTLTNASVVGNSGGGALSNRSGPTNLMHNTIVAGNFGPGLYTDVVGQFNFASSHNLIGSIDGSMGLDRNGTLFGTIDSPLNPMLRPLGTHGGETLTHALLPGSPAIDAGSDDRAAEAGLTTDQQGFDRFADGDGDGTATVDIGAVEHYPPLRLVVSTAADELDGDHGAGDLSLREALALAAAWPGQDVIEFEAGLTGSTITLEAALGQLVIDSPLDVRGPGPDELTVDADGHSRVFFVPRGVQASISGLIAHGGAARRGAGIYNAGTLTITDVRVAHGRTGEDGAGGGIYNTGTLDISDSLVWKNSVTGGRGGGICNQAGTVTIVNTLIARNTTYRSTGGGIYNRDGSLTLTGSRVFSNYCNDGGQAGGIANLNGTATLTNTLVYDNFATTTGGISNAGNMVFNNVKVYGHSMIGYCGGIDNSGTLTAERSSISGNRAQWTVGGILNTGRLTLTDSTVSENACDDTGGILNSAGVVTLSGVTLRENENHALHTSDGTLRITNSTVTQTTPRGDLDGAIVSFSSTVKLVNSTVYRNAEGGINSRAGSTVTLHNSIVAGHFQFDLVGNFDPAGSHNLIGRLDPQQPRFQGPGNRYGTAAAPLDPLLRPLEDDDGDTLSYVPGLGSPAIDAGSNAQAAEAGLTGDRRGFDRFGDGDGDGLAVVDVGACEAVAGPEILVSTSVDENDRDHSHGDLSLREALASSGASSDASVDFRVIRFDAGLSGATIALDAALGQLRIDGPVDVRGPGAELLTVDAGGSGRVLYVSRHAQAAIGGLTLTGGREHLGGAIYNRGVLAVTDAVITANRAHRLGGAVLNDGTLAIGNTTISENRAGRNGGGVANQGQLTVRNSAILDNRCFGGGGGLYNRLASFYGSGTTALANVTFSGNWAAEYGGGFYHGPGAAAALGHVTVFANSAEQGGGGIYARADAGRALLMHNTIVAGNARLGAGPDSGRDVMGPFDPDGSHNLIGTIDGSTGLDGAGTLFGTADSPLDPMLGPSQDNGGATPTHALLPGSPAIDAGSNERAADVGLTTDQRGFQRFLDGDGDGVATVDVGAYEARPVLVSTPGLYDPLAGVFHLKDSSASGEAEVAFRYGPKGHRGRIPLAGDWDGDGADTVGLYDPLQGRFHLNNSNANPPAAADVILRFGPIRPWWQPIAGDFDGDGIDTVGLYDPYRAGFHLKNSHTAGGRADVVFTYGPHNLSGWKAIVGDWDGDGVDTVGLYDSWRGAFHLNNANAKRPGGADAAFRFGPIRPGWRPVAGDFDGDRVDTVGLYDPLNAKFYLDNQNAHAPDGADVMFHLGPRDGRCLPIFGDWDGPEIVSGADIATEAQSRSIVAEALAGWDAADGRRRDRVDAQGRATEAAVDVCFAEL